MKRLLLVYLSFILPLAFIFGGGASQNTPVQPSGTVKLTLAITEDLRIIDYETNIMTRILERDANVDLDFMLFPEMDYVNKLNLMVMAGGKELPDIIIASPGDAIVYQWGREKAIIPLTKYYKDPKLSPWIHDTITRTGVDIIPMITSPDGEIYGVPGFNQSYQNEYPDRVWYYEPWLQRTGMKAPETTDEFRNVLRAVVTSDLNGNGRADEIGYTGDPNYQWDAFLMNAFVYAGNNYKLTVNNGRIGVAYNTPEWREGLKYIRSLFQEGLIPMETLTLDVTQFRTLVNAPEIQVFSACRQSMAPITSNTVAEKYMVMPPLKGPTGVRYATYWPSTPGISMMITSNCKNPDAAFRVGDLMMRPDIGIITRWGAEGSDWDYPENVPNVNNYNSTIPGYPISLIAYDDARFWGGTQASNSSWRGKGPHARAYGVANGLGISKTNPNIRDVNIGNASVLYQTGGYKPNEVIAKFIYREDELNSIVDIRVSLDNYVKEMTSAFFAGNRDIDSYWNTYVAELNNIGLARYISVSQTVYDRMYK